MNPLLGLGQFFGLLVPVGSIAAKPVPRWPDRDRNHQPGGRPMNPLLGLGQFFGLLVPVGSIAAKPVPRWPDRRSYRSHARDAAKRRNIANGGRR